MNDPQKEAGQKFRKKIFRYMKTLIEGHAQTDLEDEDFCYKWMSVSLLSV